MGIPKEELEKKLKSELDPAHLVREGGRERERGLEWVFLECRAVGGWAEVSHLKTKGAAPQAIHDSCGGGRGRYVTSEIAWVPRNTNETTSSST